MKVLLIKKTICMTALKPIPTSFARFLARNYEVNKRRMQRILEFETKSVWFSKETYLEVLGLDPNLPIQNVDGIRIYFGSYKENHSDAHKRGRMTLILVPTEPGSLPNEHNDILAQPHDFPADIPDHKLAEYNDGQLCPPNCDGDGLLNPDYQ
jgi:hypothetical protein